MDKINFSGNQVSEIDNEICQIINRWHQIDEQICGIKNRVDASILSRNHVNQTLNGLINEMRDIERSIRLLETVIQNAVRLYSSSEKKICEQEISNSLLKVTEDNQYNINNMCFQVTEPGYKQKATDDKRR